WIGRRQAKTLLSSGSPHRFCAGVGRRGIGAGRHVGDHSAVRDFPAEGISDRRASADAVRATSGDGDHASGRYPSADQRRRRHRTVADEGVDLAFCELWRVVAGGQSGRRRSVAQHFAGSAGRPAGRRAPERLWERIGRPMNIVIAAGGTGGHLYPAVALAREFLRRDPHAGILFVGTARGIESKVLAREGFELRLIEAKPVMGRGFVQAATALLSLPIGIWQSIGILRWRRPLCWVSRGSLWNPMPIPVWRTKPWGLSRSGCFWPSSPRPRPLHRRRSVWSERRFGAPSSKAQTRRPPLVRRVG